MITGAELDEIKDLGSAISRIVSGGNYVASFTCDKLEESSSLDGAIAAINKQYSRSKLQTEDTRSFNEGWLAVWKEISDRIWYGVDANDGDEPNRPPLSQEAIEQLGEYRERMERLLHKTVDEKAVIYTFGWSERLRDKINLDDYVVFWSYRFIILNPDGSAYLLHGSSSD